MQKTRVTPCFCNRLQKALQVFRIRNPERKFERVDVIGPSPDECVDRGEIWRCTGCGSLFALVAVNCTGKGFEPILVRPPNQQPSTWDWAELARIACESGQWTGPRLEKRYMID